MNNKLEKLYLQLNDSSNLNLMKARLGHLDAPTYYKSTVPAANAMTMRFKAAGGCQQQERMIKDKLRSLNGALLYSYQSAWVKKLIYDFQPVMDGVRDEAPVRALINPNKLKQDYDDKILSIDFEHDFRVGDVFEWCNTGTYWLIYLQDLDELAYFRGDIRKCRYEIEWIDEDGEKQRTFGAIRGPVETKIDFIQKHGISVDNPNYSLHILFPKTAATTKQFKRYKKFYLQGLDKNDDKVCWRVEAIDGISTPGILEVTAVEYYANEIEDDIEKGLVGVFQTKPQDPNTEEESGIIGETFIKPKKEYVYSIDTNMYGKWYVSNANFPVKIIPFESEQGKPSVRIKWNGVYSGQFDLWYGDSDGPLLDYKKTIVVESLF